MPVKLVHNGTHIADGTGAAAMGHPPRALQWPQRTLARSGDQLRVGDIVITGGLTAAVPHEHGDVLVADFGDGTAAVHLQRTPGAGSD